MGLVDEYNEVHPHIRYEQDKFAVGAYYNSMNTVSFYGSKVWSIGEDFSVEGGLVSGYEALEVPVIPFVRVNYDLSDNLRIFAAPVGEKFPDEPVRFGGLVGLELKYSFHLDN